MSFRDKVSHAAGELDEDLGKIELFNKLEAQTKIPKAGIFTGGAIAACAVVYAIFGPGLLCNLAGFVYPAYASFKAIESFEKEDDTQWLTYWVVYAAFNIVETFTDLVLGWFPFYFSFKFGFLIWCFLPNTRGAQIVYDYGVRPYLLKNEDRIDAALARTMSKAKNAIDEVGSVVGSIIDDDDDASTVPGDDAATDDGSRKDQ